jgi:hypothetical protein
MIYSNSCVALRTSLKARATLRRSLPLHEQRHPSHLYRWVCQRHARCRAHHRCRARSGILVLLRRQSRHVSYAGATLHFLARSLIRYCRRIPQRSTSVAGSGDVRGGVDRKRADAQHSVLPLRMGPCYAECGGLMYLTEALLDRDRSRHPMVGAIPGHAVMQSR